MVLSAIASRVELLRNLEVAESMRPRRDTWDPATPVNFPEPPASSDCHVARQLPRPTMPVTYFPSKFIISVLPRGLREARKLIRLLKFVTNSEQVLRQFGHSLIETHGL